MADQDAAIAALEKRIETLERQLAVLLKRTAPAVKPSREREYRDRYDSMEYPER